MKEVHSNTNYALTTEVMRLYNEGKSKSEISKILGITYVNVDGRIKKGIKYAEYEKAYPHIFFPDSPLSMHTFKAILNHAWHIKNPAGYSPYLAPSEPSEEELMDVLNSPEEELLRIRNLGRVGIAEIYTLLGKEIKPIEKEEPISYSKIFDRNSVEWTKDAAYNWSFLRAVETNVKNIIRSRGYVFLNEVYDMLGIERTKQGQVCGWIYKKNNPIELFEIFEHGDGDSLTYMINFLDVSYILNDAFVKEV